MTRRMVVVGRDREKMTSDVDIVDEAGKVVKRWRIFHFPASALKPPGRLRDDIAAGPGN